MNKFMSIKAIDLDGAHTEKIVGSEGEKGGLVGIKVTQRKYKVDEDAVRHHIRSISNLLGVGDFQVDIWYCSENKIRELNGDWRGKRRSTDVLSFPANEFVRPGKFDYDADPTLQYMKHLGDIVVAPAYVHRQCEKDRSYFEVDGSFDDDEDAGVSKAMAREFDLDRRIDLLLVHSMVHLLGYDHESPEDWVEMTAKEEEVLEALYRR
jgi:probable rRNA maturation factor